jgi:hypothetical protein
MMLQSAALLRVIQIKWNLQCFADGQAKADDLDRDGFSSHDLHFDEVSYLLSIQMWVFCALFWSVRRVR